MPKSAASTPESAPSSDCAQLRQRVISAADCPSRLLLEQIADKWSVLIIAALKGGPLRFNMIKRSLEGITQKALTQSLRRLERNGIVSRRVVPVSPLAVEYSITPLGHTLDEPFRALYTWTLDYLPQVEKARQAFDQAVLQDEAGQVVGSARAVTAGQKLTATLADGAVPLTVD
jgi:DNA-binding HxlR family transcriptional regulator